MKNTYLIVGPSGSGKSAVVNALSHLYGYTVVQSYTERPRRSPNESGHIFVTPQEFDELGPLCAYTEYDGNRYGVTVTMFETSDLYVIDPAGVEYLRSNYTGMKGVYVIGIECAEDSCMKHMLHRGDSETSVNSRIIYDREAFKELYNMCDVVVTNSQDLRTLVDKVHQIIQAEES